MAGRDRKRITLTVDSRVARRPQWPDVLMTEPNFVKTFFVMYTGSVQGVGGYTHCQADAYASNK